MPLAKPSTKSLASFAWISTYSSPSVHRFISINKDALIESTKLQESFKISWQPRGNMVISGGQGYEIFEADRHGEYDEDLNGIERREIHQEQLRTPSILTGSLTPSTVHRIGDEREGVRTPRPGDTRNKDVNLLRRRLNDMALKQQHQNRKDNYIDGGGSEVYTVWKTLRTDISVIMRKRAEEGYSMDVSNKKNYFFLSL